MQRAKHPRKFERLLIKERRKPRFIKAGARSFDLPSATCIASSHESKSACQPLKAGARSLDLLSANIWINIHTTKYFRKYFFFLDLSLLLML